LSLLILGDTTYGQKCLYQLGMTGIPIYNVCHIRGNMAYISATSLIFTCATPASAVLAVERWLAGWLDVCLYLNG